MCVDVTEGCGVKKVSRLNVEEPFIMCQNIENYFTNDQNLSEENLTMKTINCYQRKDVDYALYLGQNSSKHHLIVLSVFSRCLC